MDFKIIDQIPDRDVTNSKDSFHSVSSEMIYAFVDWIHKDRIDIYKSNLKHLDNSCKIILGETVNFDLKYRLVVSLKRECYNELYILFEQLSKNVAGGKDYRILYKQTDLLDLLSKRPNYYKSFTEKVILELRNMHIDAILD